MKIIIDSDAKTVQLGEESPTLELYSDEAFAVLSRLWLKVGWNQRYSYRFTWLGRPVIQLPEDLLRIQEVIYRLRPTVIIETGVAHGGSLIFYATLCHALERGQVIGIDLEIRPHNRSALEQHPLSRYLHLIEGDSAHAGTVARVRSRIAAADTVIVILDSNHSYRHVTDELNAYAPLVTPGSYLVATDGIMGDLYDTPTGQMTWKTDNPARATEDFVAAHPEFVMESPTRLFDEGRTRQDVSYWPGAWLRRR